MNRTITHGMSYTAEYAVWSNMLGRCTRKSHPYYEDYGGRGITVCERWKKFAAFYQDMGPRPKGFTMERINNDAGYEPGNCRWATQGENNHNKRRRGTGARAKRARERRIQEGRAPIFPRDEVFA